MQLGQEYTREQVHKIFSPDTQFTPQTGTWGLHGIVAIPSRESDFVFFVTYGQSQGEHVFDEGITEDGVLSWQSQPSQHFDEKRIKKFIGHEDQLDNIYLFLRESRGLPYKYLGRLGYITHDPSREKPVWFQWQLLDWDEIPNELRPDLESSSARLEEVSGSVEAEKKSTPKPATLEFDDELPAPKIAVTDQQTFRAIKAPDYSAQDARNRKLGLEGELLVLKSEKDHLIASGRTDLAEQVVHTSVEEGDGAGYDIASFHPDGSPLHIEVKTTRGGPKTDFFMSPRELAFSQRNPKSYRLVRLYAWKEESKSARAYILEGDLTDQTETIPTNFRVRLK